MNFGKGEPHDGKFFLRILFISVGDGGNPPVRLDGRFIREKAQDLSIQLGSLVRINDDGSVPPDNPFIDQQEMSPDIFSYGHLIRIKPVEGGDTAP